MNFRLIALGDTHGRNTWETILGREHYDVAVLVGDYFDTKEDISGAKQIYNFQKILEYKKAHKDRVVLLFGNHDYHYMRYTRLTYSGFQHGAGPEINRVLQEALDQDLLQMAYQYENFLFSHAGIGQTWLERVPWKAGIKPYGWDEMTIVDQVNLLFKIKPTYFDLLYSDSGDSMGESPIWIRPEAFRKDQIPGYVQVMGHTMQKNIDSAGKSNGCKFFLIDSIWKGNYLIIDNGKVTHNNTQNFIRR